MTKILKTYSSEHIVNDKEVSVIIKNQNSDSFLLLDNGEYIKPKSIIAITDPELIPYWDGYMLDKGGKSFMRNGNRIFLESQDFDKIEYKIHPKYEKIKQLLLEKTNLNKHLNQNYGRTKNGKSYRRK